MGGFLWPAQDSERLCENTINEVSTSVPLAMDDCLISELCGVGAWEKSRERLLQT